MGLVTSATSMGSGGSVLSVQILTFVPLAITLESIAWTINSLALTIRMTILITGMSSSCYVVQCKYRWQDCSVAMVIFIKEYLGVVIGLMFNFATMIFS